MGVSGNEDEIRGTALTITKRVRARRTLVGISTIYLGMAIGGFAGYQTLRWLGPLAIIAGLLLQLPWAPMTWRPYSLRKVRRIARVAEMPELPATVVVYACITVGFAGIIAMVVTEI